MNIYTSLKVCLHTERNLIITKLVDTNIKSFHLTYDSHSPKNYKATHVIKYCIHHDRKKFCLLGSRNLIFVY